MIRIDLFNHANCSTRAVIVTKLGRSCTEQLTVLLSSLKPATQSKKGDTIHVFV